MSDAADRYLVHVAQSMATKKTRCVSVGMVIVLTIRALMFHPRDDMVLKLQSKRRPAENRQITMRALDDGCGISLDTVSSTVTWSTFTAGEATAFRALQACIKRIPQAKPSAMVPHHGPNVSALRMLQCRQKVTVNETQSVVQGYETMWFIGDSVLEQQFYVFLCMVDPWMTLHQIHGSGLPDAGESGSVDHTIAAQWTYHHSDGTGATRVICSKFGRVWEGSERNLCVDAFPQAFGSLNEKGAIVLDAANHYDTHHFPEMRRAVTFIRDKSLITNASIFYMESNPEEWPTSNGMCVDGCMWLCQCEALGADRIMGRGSLSDPQVNLTKTVELLRSGDPPIKFFDKLFPDLAFANNTELCIPDCAPATWRSDLARLILNETRNRVRMVPVCFLRETAPTNLSMLSAQNSYLA
jgi:hypothetical protein